MIFTRAVLGRMVCMNDRIQIHPDDNVAVALRDLPESGVSRGHKVALQGKWW